MTRRKIRKGLPANIAASVGRIISRWAYQEYLLHLVAYMCLDVKIEQGRIAVRQGNIRDQLTMIEDLLLIRGIAFRKKYVANLAAKIEKAKRKRDGLAHSLYLDTDKGIAIQDTKSQNWQVHGPKNFNIRRTKKMSPSFILLDNAYLGGLRKEIESCIKDTLKFLDDAIDALTTLQKTQLARRQSKENLLDQTSNTPLSQQVSSEVS